jgi:hypothetical protein
VARADLLRAEKILASIVETESLLFECGDDRELTRFAPEALLAYKDDLQRALDRLSARERATYERRASAIRRVLRRVA